MLAPGGGAIGGAVVLIGSEDDHDADGSLPHPRLRLLADDQGRFTTDAVRPGTTVVRAGADGWAVSATNVVIAPGATTTIDVVLANGATIRGHVTSAGGAPAPDVSIHSGDAQLEAFDALHTTSGAAGEFTLAHVPAGRATVTARSLGNRSATTTLQVADGEIAEWNPVLPDGASIGGRALDEHDVPLANHTIVACHDATGAMSCVRSGADGGFTLRDLAAGNHLVAVYPPGGRIGGEPLAYVAGVNAGSTDVLLRVTDATRPSARVRGTVLTPDDGVPSGRSAQALVPRPFGIVTAVADIDRDRGTFELGPLPPGSYQLKACVDGFREQTLCDFTLTKDQLLDLGDLFLRAQ
ncbi:MAG: carboxypeptidase regulatory-like domain-containing protein [Planctomycetota bacterium]